MRLDRGYGSPYDRGRIDSYYRRQRNPHYYKGETVKSELVVHLSPEEIVEYNQGFDDNEAAQNFNVFY